MSTCVNFMQTPNKVQQYLPSGSVPQPQITKKQYDDADEFIRQQTASVEKLKKGSFASKYLGSITAVIPLILTMCYDIFTLAKCKKLKKAGQIKALKQHAKSSLIKLLSAFTVSFAALFGLPHYFKQGEKKHFDEIKKYFDNTNKTSAKLSPNTLKSSIIAAAYCPMTGKIIIGNIKLNDPLSRLTLKSVIRHELVHAKQYETIARSKDGIKKINYAVLYNFANQIKNNPAIKAIKKCSLGNAKQEKLVDTEYWKVINGRHEAIINDKTGKYDNIKFPMLDTQVDLKKFVLAIHILLNKKDATYNDIPILIDTKHYEDAIKKNGALSAAEEKKANLYYKATLEYPNVNFWQGLNPFSDYYNNILEKEAFKENPWYTRII